jgi:mRNA interferase RelE/StbE
MTVEFLKSFSKDLDKITSSIVKSQIKQVIISIENTANLREIPNIKKLKGHRSAYRIRIGDYRLGLFFENNTVILARFLHRKDVYKIFP